MLLTQVLEGALEGTKSLLANSEKDKLSLEAQIQQLMVEAARSEAEHTKKVEDLNKQIQQGTPRSSNEHMENDKSETATLRLELLNKMVSCLCLQAACKVDCGIHNLSHALKGKQQDELEIVRAISVNATLYNR